MNEVHIGTMGWSYGFWVGNFYPQGTRPDEYLTEYGKHFDTVEVDMTFYRNPSKSALLKWKEQTPEGFLFSAKFPRGITHVKMLRDCERETEYFLENISTLGEKLGPLLLQFPTQFTAENLNLLQDFLATLPSKMRFAVEVRNKNMLQERLYSILSNDNVSLTITDRLFAPEAIRMTTDFVYMRWEGDRTKVNGTLGRIETEKTSDIQAWASAIKDTLESPAKLFGYFSKYYSGHPPTDVETLLKYLV